jgi:3-isopropylmalate/(R)-2-methylmalate dehydratase small subunit
LPNGEIWAFEVDAFRRDCLLKGLDDIGITLERAEAIETFERQHRDRFPWVFEDISL